MSFLISEYIHVLSEWCTPTSQGQKRSLVLGTLLDFALYTASSGCSFIFLTSKCKGSVFLSFGSHFSKLLNLREGVIGTSDL